MVRCPGSAEGRRALASQGVLIAAASNKGADERRVGGERVGDLVISRVGAVTWSARHRDFLSETDIACSTGSGLCQWELAYSPPRPWLPAQPFYITPTNRAAATLAPELMPAGLTDARRFPEQAYRAGAIYDIADPKKARERLEPFMRAKFPDLFRTDQGE